LSKNIFGRLFNKKQNDKTESDTTTQSDVEISADRVLSHKKQSTSKSPTIESVSPPNTSASATITKEEVRIDTDDQLEVAKPIVESTRNTDLSTPADNEETKSSLFSRLTKGLSRTSNKISDGVTSIFTKRKLDDETLEELEDLLISADLGVTTANKVTSTLAKEKFEKEVSSDVIRKALADVVSSELIRCEAPLEIDLTKKPHVILMTGVNGAGKTTTIGKLAAQYQRQGLKTKLVAGDTFRAAAIEQLTVWGNRTGATVMTRQQGADPAGLVFDALKSAKEDGTDIVIIDTAGRLQNRQELMDELAKIVRVMKKIDASLPNDVILVLDATVGQNALSQTSSFQEIAGVTGLIMTKLDGTARGGVLIALAEKFSLPIHFVGIGENIDDLQPFKAIDFANALAGVTQTDTE